jgi:hypothetical protein
LFLLDSCTFAEKRWVSSNEASRLLARATLRQNDRDWQRLVNVRLSARCVGGAGHHDLADEFVGVLVIRLALLVGRWTAVGLSGRFDGIVHLPIRLVVLQEILVILIVIILGHGCFLVLSRVCTGIQRALCPAIWDVMVCRWEVIGLVCFYSSALLRLRSARGTGLHFFDLLS